MMNFNFNKKNKIIHYFAEEGQNIKDHNILSEKTSTLFNLVINTITKTHMEGDPSTRRKMVSAMGCIDKLRACLLYSKRIGKYTNIILNRIPQDKYGMYLISDDTILAEYESFIFHSRALLDRLTFYVCKQIYNQSCDRFSKFKKCIEHSIRKDSITDVIIKYIDKCLPMFVGILIDDGQKRCLRSKLIHKSTIIEETGCAFTIFRQPQGHVFLFDYSILNYPLFGSTRDLTKYTVYIVLGILSTCFEISNDIVIDDCNPLWDNIFIDYNKYQANGEDSVDLSIGKMNPSGFEIKNIKISKSFMLIK